MLTMLPCFLQIFIMQARRLQGIGVEVLSGTLSRWILACEGVKW